MLGYYVVNSYKSFGETVPILNDESYLTLISSTSALFSAARFIWSAALDRYDFKKVYGSLCLLQIALAFSVRLTELSRISFAGFICLVLFCVGGHFTFFPNLLKQIYGQQATFLYTVMFTGTGAASLFIVGLVLSPLGKHYYLLFDIFGAFSAFALIIALFIFKQPPRQID